MSAPAEAVNFNTARPPAQPIAEVFPDTAFPLDDANYAVLSSGLINGGALTEPTVHPQDQESGERSISISLRTRALDLMTGRTGWGTPGASEQQVQDRNEAFLAATAHRAARLGYDLVPSTPAEPDAASAKRPLSEIFSEVSFPLDEGQQHRVAAVLGRVLQAGIGNDPQYSRTNAVNYAYGVITHRYPPTFPASDPTRADSALRFLLASTASAAAKQGYDLVPRQAPAAEGATNG